jgi:hypothetical protein
VRFLPSLRRSSEIEERDASYPLALQQYVELLKFNNVLYPLGFQQTLVGNREELRGDYMGLASGAYESNSVVCTLMTIRMLHFAEARFQFQQLRGGRPGNLFGAGALAPLETPWLNGTTGDLLNRMIQDVDLCGNSYIIRDGPYLARLRPDWVSILLGSRRDRPGWVPGDPDTIVVGYVYKPGGPRGTEPEQVYGVERVAHFAPYPSPLAIYRGRSWLTSAIREIQADQQMNDHRLRFFENGATVNLAIKAQPAVQNQTQFQEWVKVIQENHEGTANAHKILFLAAGTDVVPIGSDLQQVDFKAVQTGGETRLCALANVPAPLAGFTEGISGSSLNEGNYKTAYRRFADGTIRPLWRQAAGALASIIQVPSAARLWYDDRDIAFLKDDEKDAADIRQKDATTINTLFMAGYDPDAIIDAVTSDDFSRLFGTHSGLQPVQTHPSTNGSSTNGSGATKELASAIARDVVEALGEEDADEY